MDKSAPLTKEELQVLLEKCFWKYARTLGHNPHHYTLRDTWKNNQLFDDVVISLRAYSRPEKFYKQTYQMCYLGNFKYWTMGSPLPETILINKKQTVLAKY